MWPTLAKVRRTPVAAGGSLDARRADLGVNVSSGVARSRDDGSAGGLAANQAAKLMRKGVEAVAVRWPTREDQVQAREAKQKDAARAFAKDMAAQRKELETAKKASLAETEACAAAARDLEKREAALISDRAAAEKDVAEREAVLRTDRADIESREGVIAQEREGIAAREAAVEAAEKALASKSAVAEAAWKEMEDSLAALEASFRTQSEEQVASLDARQAALAKDEEALRSNLLSSKGATLRWRPRPGNRGKSALDSRRSGARWQGISKGERIWTRWLFLSRLGGRAWTKWTGTFRRSGKTARRARGERSRLSEPDERKLFEGECQMRMSEIAQESMRLTMEETRLSTSRRE